MTGRSYPVRNAYDAVAQLDVQCPNCGADPYLYCRHDDGRPRRIPCLARVNANGKGAVS